METAAQLPLQTHHVASAAYVDILNQLDKNLYAYGRDEALVISSDILPHVLEDWQYMTQLPAISPSALGNPEFRKTFNLRYAYVAGAMANGIASVALVEALANAGLLASFGAGGMIVEQVAESVQLLRQRLGDKPFAVNIIHSPHEMRMEECGVEICLKNNVSIIEASAFIELTLPLIRYRASGLSVNQKGEIQIAHRIIAKVSRLEVAKQFLSPAPVALLDQLVSQNLITPEQALWAQKIPMADAITAEADSGGHTDRQPHNVLLPAIIELRNQIVLTQNYAQSIFVGAAGGIGTGAAAAAAFVMGADYIVTGSVNQACLEAGTSEPVRQLLAQANITDVSMAPAADMFEMGVQLQVLKRGTLFAARAKQLHQIYENYEGLDDIPSEIRHKIETQIFRRTLDEVWKDTIDYFNQRDPRQILAAQESSKRKMALIFRAYLGQASHWANAGILERKIDFQIWSSPAMGAFNQWVKGTYLEPLENRRVLDVAEHIMRAATFYLRVMQLKLQQPIHVPGLSLCYQIQPLNE